MTINYNGEPRLRPIAFLIDHKLYKVTPLEAGQGGVVELLIVRKSDIDIPKSIMVPGMPDLRDDDGRGVIQFT